MRPLVATGLLLLVALSPDVAHACPGCFQGKTDASRLAFLASTLFMTLLPLALFGGLVYWVKRRSDALDEAEKASWDAPESDGPPPLRAVGSTSPGSDSPG